MNNYGYVFIQFLYCITNPFDNSILVPSYLSKKMRVVMKKPVVSDID
jgi:hypothetical protein